MTQVFHDLTAACVASRITAYGISDLYDHGAEIIRDVAAKDGLTAKDLTGPSREMAVSLARSEAMSLIRTRLKWSLTRIGRAFGNRHHTTVLHNLRAYEDRLHGREDRRKYNGRCR